MTRSITSRAIRFVVAATATLAVVLGGEVIPADASGGGGGVGSAPAPGAPGVLPRGDYFAPTISAGSTWTSDLLVANDSAQAATILVYGADGLTAIVSGAVYSNLGQPLHSAGAWVHPASHTVTIPAQGQATVRFSVTVPQWATPGDHLAGIVAESGSLGTSGSGRVRVNVVARAVVGVLIRVPGPASFYVRVGTPTINRGPDQIGEVVTPLIDTGRLIGKPTIKVSLSGPGGYNKSVTRQVDTLLPGGTAQFPVYWPDRLHGTYRITSCVSWAGLTRSICSSTSVTVNGTTNNTGNPPKLRNTGLHLPGWAVELLSAGGGAGLLGLLLVLRRRFHSGARHRNLPDYKADALLGTQPGLESDARSKPAGVRGR
ncbi:MAG: hypothetical protein ACLP6E_10855 [Acidimicrobiales bacterium]